MNLRKNMEKLSKRNLQYFPKFYLAFTNEQTVNACVHNLNWIHFRALLRVSDENARLWYMNEAFYIIEIKCYVRMDLQMGKITHQDVG